MTYYKLSHSINKFFVFVIRNPIYRKKKVCITVLDCRITRSCKQGVLMLPPARSASPARLPLALDALMVWGIAGTFRLIWRSIDVKRGCLGWVFGCKGCRYGSYNIFFIKWSILFSKLEFLDEIYRRAKQSPYCQAGVNPARGKASHYLRTKSHTQSGNRLM